MFNILSTVRTQNRTFYKPYDVHATNQQLLSTETLDLSKKQDFNN